MVERQKIEFMAAKRHRNKRRISSSSREERNHESNTRDDTYPDQAKDQYQLQLWVTIGEKLQTTKKMRLEIANGKKKEGPGYGNILYPPQLQGIILVIMKWELWNAFIYLWSEKWKASIMIIE